MEQKQIFTVKGVNAPKTKLGLAKMNKILEVAESLIANGNFFSTSVAEICKLTGTAVGTFYIYFESKAALYSYLMETYKHQIKRRLAKSVQTCTTRLEMEREGIKCFVKYAVENPNVYNVIWGSLAVDKPLFVEYYESFAKNYTKGLTKFNEEIRNLDYTTMSYALMGITNFVALKAIFEGLNEKQIDQMIDQNIMPFLSNGMFK